LIKHTKDSVRLSQTFFRKLLCFCWKTLEDCAKVAQKQLAVLERLQCLWVNEAARAIKQRNTFSRRNMKSLACRPISEFQSTLQEARAMTSASAFLNKLNQKE